MEQEYLSGSVEETKNKIVEKVFNEIVQSGISIVLLQGELGAGKTTFAQGILEKLGAEGPYTSPTFVIMKRYSLSKSQITNHKLQINYKIQSAKWWTKFNFIYHFDCYRVGSQDILELSWEEIVANPENLVLVEWPEKIKEILPENFIKLSFNIIDEKRRKILITDKPQLNSAPISRFNEASKK